jgi:hypothetical protein
MEKLLIYGVNGLDRRVTLVYLWIKWLMRGIGETMQGDRRESETGPARDLASAQDLVCRTVRAIDACGMREFDVLLSDLLCAAWPTNRAQSQ